MSAAYDKLKELLEKQGKLSNDEIAKVVAEHGEMTDEEKVSLEAERHKRERESQATITLEQYLEASKVLDTAAEGSDEYKKAEEIVNKYESGM